MAPLCCQQAVRSGVPGWDSAGPGSDLSEVPAMGFRSVALDCRVAPTCPAGPVRRRWRRRPSAGRRRRTAAVSGPALRPSWSCLRRFCAGSVIADKATIPSKKSTDVFTADLRGCFPSHSRYGYPLAAYSMLTVRLHEPFKLEHLDLVGLKPDVNALTE